VTIWIDGTVAFISNGTIVNTYSTICESLLSRISVDSYGYFAISCNGKNQTYLYDSNMQYTNKSIQLGVNINDARLDTNNRLAICGGKNVTIYN
jgi:hypothetical protein